MAEKRVLNVGCGQRFEGTDRIDFMKTPATTKICNIEEGLPYEDNIFDKIICYRVLEHLRDLKSFMEECYRVLKKGGGEMHLQTDNAGFLIFHIKNDHNLYVERQTKKHIDNHHYHLFVPSHLKYLFQMAGFKNIKINYVQVQKNMLKRIIQNLLPFNMGKEEIKVVAVKG